MALFKSVLLSPLPRAYDEVPAGVLPVDRDQHLIGLNVHADGLMTASREVKERLQQEVLLPLEQWLTEYRNTKVGRCTHTHIHTQQAHTHRCPDTYTHTHNSRL